MKRKTDSCNHIGLQEDDLSLGVSHKPCTWIDTEDISGDLDEHLPHGGGANGFAARQILSGLKAAVGGTGRMKRQYWQLLNSCDQTEQVCRHHYIGL